MREGTIRSGVAWSPHARSLPGGLASGGPASVEAFLPPRRGITQKRGKCSAICACKGLASLQSYPGHDGIPDLPEGDTIADFHTAQAIAREQCGYGTALMELPSLQAAPTA